MDDKVRLATLRVLDLRATDPENPGPVVDAVGAAAAIANIAIIGPDDLSASDLMLALLPDDVTADELTEVCRGRASSPMLLIGPESTALAVAAGRAGAIAYLLPGPRLAQRLACELALAAGRLPAPIPGSPAPDVLGRLIDDHLDGILVADPDGRLLYANRAAEELLGRDSETLLGELLGRPLVAEHACEVQVFRADQTPCAAEMRASPIWWEGQPAWLVALRDTTARARAEQILRESEERFRTLFDSAVDAIYIIDLEGQVVDANATAAAQLGYTHQELRQLRLADIDPHDVNQFPHRLGEMRRRGQVLFETMHRRSDGSTFPVEVHACLSHHQGQPAAVAFARDLTARREAEAAHEARRQQLRLVVESITELVVTIDPEMRYTGVYGRPSKDPRHNPADLLGRQMGEVFEPGVAADMEQAARRALLGETVLCAWEQVVDGTTRRYESTYAPLRADDGVTVVGVLGVRRNVTELWQATTALQQTELRFQTMVENAADLFGQIDAEQCLSYVSPRWEQVLGFSASQLLGHPLARLVHPDDIALVTGAIGEALAGQASRQPIVYRIRAADGGWRWHETRLTLIGEVTDANRYVILIAADQTSRREAEAEMRRLSTAVEQAAEAVVITDASDVIEYVNPAFTALTGWPRREALGRRLADLTAGKKATAAHAACWVAVAAGQRWSGQFPARRRDGNRFHESASAAPVFTADGRLSGVVWLRRDVTHETTLQEQLQHSQKMEALGRLAGSVAHDFNNVLTTIIGCADFLRGEELPDEIREDVEQIALAADRATGLTRQLLAVSRRQQLQARTVDLRDLLPSLARTLRRTLPESISIHTEFHAEPLWVKVDPAQLEQAVLNLAVNARDAMPDGGRLSLLARPERDGERRRIRIEVSDTGSGIPEAIRGRVFEPFFTTKERGRGTGLGLSTADSSITAAGGELRCESVVGQGTTFIVLLPESEPEAASAETTGPRRDGHGDEQILVVEDEPSVRHLVRRALQSAGYRVLEAADADEAEALLAQHGESVDAMLCDVVMPGRSGPKLAAELAVTRPALPIVFMTGYADSEDLQRAQEYGAGVLAKPFTPEALRQIIRATLDQGGRRLTPEAPDR